MPTVPRAQRQVEQRPLSGAQLNPSAPDAAFAPKPGLELRGVQQFIEQERQKADQVAVLEADNRLNETAVELERGALAKKGKDAMGATAAARAAWDQAASDVAGELTSERARMAVAQRASSRWGQLHSSIEAHAAAEADKYDTEQTTVALSNRHNDAVAHYQDPSRVAAALGESEAILRDFGRRRGLPPEVVDEKIAAARSAAHVGILNRMLANGQDRDATAYFQAHQAEIQGDELAGVEKALEVGSTLGKSQRNSDEILYGPKPASSRREAYERARAIEDPKERQATEQRLDTEFARRDRDEREQYEDILGEAQQYVARGELPPAPIMAKLKPAQQSSVRALVKRAAAGTPTHTDPKTLYELMLEAGSPDPATRQKFAERNLLEYADKLSQSDLEQLTREQVKARKGEAASADARGAYTTRQRIDRAIKNTKVKPGSDEDVKIHSDVDRAVQAQLAATGKKALTPDETDDIIARTVVRHFYIDTPNASDPAKRGVEITSDERGRAYVPLEFIPPADQARIRQIMTSRGIAKPTNRQIERAFAASQLGDMDLFDDLVSGPTYTGPR